MGGTVKEVAVSSVICR